MTAAGPALTRGYSARDHAARFSRLVSFDSELIRLRIESGDSLEVEGLYRFSCSESAPTRYGLVYPFPEDSLMGGVRIVASEFRRAGEPWREMEIQWAPLFGGVIWRMPLAGASECEVRTVYRQALLGNHARYIVTTTQGWEQPLQSARFEVFLSPDLPEPRFSFPFAPCDSLGENAYLFETTEFWPEKDIIIEWDDPAEKQ